MKHNAFFGQESPGHALLPVNHPLWTALGVPDGSHIRLVPPSKDSEPSVVALVGSNETARKFVEEGLGFVCISHLFRIRMFFVCISYLYFESFRLKYEKNTKHIQICYDHFVYQGISCGRHLDIRNTRSSMLKRLSSMTSLALAQKEDQCAMSFSMESSHTCTTPSPLILTNVWIR